MGPPAGGRLQGMLSRRPSSTGHVGRYDAYKHGWYHPLGQVEGQRLAASDQEESGSKGLELVGTRSSVWIMRKAKNHMGYGHTGKVDRV